MDIIYWVQGKEKAHREYKHTACVVEQRDLGKEKSQVLLAQQPQQVEELR